jgi:DHA1 family inner membrane transport protein
MDSLRAAVVVLGAQAVVLLGAVAAVHSRVLAPVAAFAVGALSLALVPVVQTVVVDAAREAPVLASASMQADETGLTSGPAGGRPAIAPR